MNTRLIALAGAFALSLSLAACTGDSSDGQTTVETTEATSAESADVEAQTSEETDEQAEDLEAAFGETVTWKSGHEVTITPPTPYEIENPYTKEQYPGSVVLLEVTHKNGTEEPYSAAMPSITATSGGKEAARVFADDIDLPTADIMPGDSLTWPIAFEVADPADISLKYELFTFEDDPAYFSVK